MLIIAENNCRNGTETARTGAQIAYDVQQSSPALVVDCGVCRVWWHVASYCGVALYDIALYCLVGSVV